jgi:hypothetical protein
MAKKKSVTKKSMRPCIDGPETAMEEILAAEPTPYIELEDMYVYDSTHEISEEEAFIAEPTPDIELAASMIEYTPKIEFKEVPMDGPTQEFPTEEAPFAERTFKVATEETYNAISKDLPVTEESKKEPYTGSDSTSQQAREW